MYARPLRFDLTTSVSLSAVLSSVHFSYCFSLQNNQVMSAFGPTARKMVAPAGLILYYHPYSFYSQKVHNLHCCFFHTDNNIIIFIEGQGFLSFRVRIGREKV